MEDKATYEVEKEETVGDAYRIFIRQAGMIRDLIERGYGKNKSDIVRKAIDFYYQNIPDRELH